MLGGLLSAYHLSVGGIMVRGVQKEVATYKDQILMFIWTMQKILETASWLCLQVVHPMSPSSDVIGHFFCPNKINYLDLILK
jgi:hypothetical protein